MLVIADASPLHYLLLIGHVEILPALYERIIVPEKVFAELRHQRTPTIVREWVETRPGWLEVRQAHLTASGSLAELDDGERDAMSRAFIKEDATDWPVSLLDRPLSPLPNFMTPEGHRLMSQQLSQLQDDLAALKSSQELSRRSRQAHLERDIRYCLARLQSARLVQPPATAPDRVIFGCTVTFVDGQNNASCYQIVGEDEADIKTHKISWASPLARALMNKQEGEVGLWCKPAGTVEIEIIRIECRTYSDQANTEPG